MIHRLFTLAPVASLALCAATATQGVRAGRTAQTDLVGFASPFGPLVARFDRTGVTVVGIGRPVAGESAARGVVEQMRNAELAFECRALQSYWFGDPVDLYKGGPSARAGTPTARLMEGAEAATGCDAYRRPLLDALDDPDRFVAAHAVLAHRERTHRTPWSAYPVRPGNGHFVLDADGLRVELPPPRRPAVSLRYIGPPGVPVWTYGWTGPAAARVDPDQQRGIRNGWISAMGRTLVSVPYWPVCAVTAVPPILWAARRAARWERGGRGLCPACGYDLRATPEQGGTLLDRCPECGRAVAA